LYGGFLNKKNPTASSGFSSPIGSFLKKDGKYAQDTQE
jgi:hypothetical protein